MQGYDRYAYVNNSPVRYTDPSGHYDECSVELEGCVKSKTSPGLNSRKADKNSEQENNGNCLVCLIRDETEVIHRMFVWVLASPFGPPAHWQETTIKYYDIWDGGAASATFYTGSWIPWVDMALDVGGIATDLATYFTGGEPFPTVYASGIEILWASSKAANGDATSMYTLERKMYNDAAAVPYLGIGASIGSLFLNIDEITHSWEKRIIFVETWDSSFPNYPPPLKGK